MRRGATPDTAPQVIVRNLQRAVPIDVAGLENFAEKALRLCLQLRESKQTDLTKQREISILLISDRRMALLHRRFLNQSGLTDVITFQHGEIFISVDAARRHARVFGSSFPREVRLYIIHGLVHLYGFDDQSEADAKEMRATQEKILAASS